MRGPSQPAQINHRVTIHATAIRRRRRGWGQLCRVAGSMHLPVGRKEKRDAAGTGHGWLANLKLASDAHHTPSRIQHHCIRARGCKVCIGQNSANATNRAAILEPSIGSDITHDDWNRLRLEVGGGCRPEGSLVYRGRVLVREYRLCRRGKPCCDKEDASPRTRWACQHAVIRLCAEGQVH